MSDLFGVGTSIEMAFDARRRLRIIAPEHLIPLAAWLYTDVQPNIAGLDEFGKALQRCRAEESTLVGNGCNVDFVNDLVLVENRFGTWTRQVVPQHVFWSIFGSFRSFLVATAQAPVLRRPAGYPPALRLTAERPLDDGDKPVLVNHTYFPVDWSIAEVRQAGDGAWQSEEVLRDRLTGAWSGMWRGLELAGYYDVGTGEVLTYFPVVSP